MLEGMVKDKEAQRRTQLRQRETWEGCFHVEAGIGTGILERMIQSKWPAVKGRNCPLSWCEAAWCLSGWDQNRNLRVGAAGQSPAREEKGGQCDIKGRVHVYASSALLFPSRSACAST